MIDNELQEFPILRTLQDKKWFDAPEGYFESLPQQLLFQIEKTKPIDYQDIPIHYFETFNQNLWEKIVSIETPILSNLPKKDSFSDVPDDYFDNFTENLRPHLERLEELTDTPILAKIAHQNTENQDTNSQYFEQFYTNLQPKLTTFQTKRVPFFAWQNIAKYGLSAAASVAFILGLFWLMPNNKSEIGNEVGFSSLSKQEIVQALASEDYDEDELAEELSKTSLENLNIEELSDKEINQLLEDIDAEEILQ